MGRAAAAPQAERRAEGSDAPREHAVAQHEAPASPPGSSGESDARGDAKTFTVWSSNPSSDSSWGGSAGATRRDD
jgi:hypothetical protein